VLATALALGRASKMWSCLALGTVRLMLAISCSSSLQRPRCIPEQQSSVGFVGSCAVHQVNEEGREKKRGAEVEAETRQRLAASYDGGGALGINPNQCWDAIPGPELEHCWKKLLVPGQRERMSERMTMR